MILTGPHSLAFVLFPYNTSEWASVAWLPTFLKISSFVFCERKSYRFDDWLMIGKIICGDRKEFSSLSQIFLRNSVCVPLLPPYPHTRRADSLLTGLAHCH